MEALIFIFGFVTIVGVLSIPIGIVVLLIALGIKDSSLKKNAIKIILIGSIVSLVSFTLCSISSVSSVMSQ